MQAFVLAAAVAMTCGANSGLVSGKRYSAQITLCEGDPLGTRDEGAVHFLCQPSVCLLAGQKGHFKVVQGSGFDQVMTVGITPESRGTVRLEFDFRMRQVIGRTESGETSKVTTAKHERVISLAQPATFRIAAESATRQLWVVVNVHEHEPAIDPSAVEARWKAPVVHQFSGPRR